MELETINTSRLNHSLRPHTSTRVNTHRKKRAQSTTAPAHPSPEPTLSTDQKRKQDQRIKKSAELSHSGFLTETLPLMTRIESNSEFVIKIEYTPPTELTHRVRSERKKMIEEQQRGNLGWGTKNVAMTPGKQQRMAKKDTAIVRRAKLEYMASQKRIQTLLKNEMKGVRRLEKKNTVERQYRFVEIISVITSLLSFQESLRRAKLAIAYRGAAVVLQRRFRKFIQQR